MKKREANTRAGAEMEERPRETSFWRRQEEFLGEVIETAWDDPEIQACWNGIALELNAVLRQHVLPTETEIRAMFAPLISLLRDRVPALEHQWESEVGQLVQSLTIKTLLNMSDSPTPKIDVHIPEKIAHFLPDNPVTISRDPSTGKPILHDVETAEARHLLQIRSYFHSLAPPGKPGRPKGSPKPSKSGRRSISPEAALRAYNMDSHGAHWREIAKALWPAITPADLRNEKTRLKVRYYVERGDRLARKKSVE